MQKFSYLKSINADYLEDQFQKYLKNPDSIDPTWRYFFEGMEFGTETAAPLPNGHANGAGFEQAAPRAVVAPATASTVDMGGEAKVANLILAYREYGTYVADIDPLHPAASSHPMLELARHGLTSADLGRVFQAGKLIGLGPASLNDIIATLKRIYCSTTGVEYVHIKDPSEREWVRAQVETPGVQPGAQIDAETRKYILRRLTEAESFERFLHARYVAQKRFSIEGAESTLPALDCMVETSAALGATDFVLGMAHRGRLNVLTNLLGKKPEYIFTEFEGNYKVDLSHGEGDVKYHQGYSADRQTRAGKTVHISLAANASHLEFVDAVIEGAARAKQDLYKDAQGTRVLPIMIHGDAAFAGQGVVYETVNMSQLAGYKTGGTIHFVINNQVGFTADAVDTRSSTYCTDLAKMIDAPVFHVNGDDPEAVWRVSRLCSEYRARFHKDSFIDLVCYRKHGHNEGDEPSFTQPLMYKAIKAHPSTREIYAGKLQAEGLAGAEESQKLTDSLNAAYTKAQTVAKADAPHPEPSVFEGRWKGIKRAKHEDLFKPVNTAVPEKKLKQLAEKLNTIPPGFHLHPKLTRFFETRLHAVRDGKGIDWGNGETLAYATLLTEGFRIRLSGQDAERGTFTHRHSVLKDYETGESYVPLNHLNDGVGDGQALYSVYNSHLSEAAVLGFDFGYSITDPGTLVIWEAQFGDFANGGQVIIDQFIAASESKWQRMSGLTLLLPHGYEGQAAEHSSGRLERFLQLAGRDNMAVVNLTTPAQIFHALRRQMKRDFRKPLVVMSPKSLLRLAQAVSTLDEFTDRGFQEAIDDPAFANAKDAATVASVALCSGKVYYDLLAERATLKGAKPTALVRVEQLYPFPEKALAAVLGRYPKAKDLLWVQEEPRNMGAWSFVFGNWCGGFDEFSKQVGGRGIRYIGRDVGAAPAVGSAKQHEKEQRALVESAFEGTAIGRA